MTLPLLDELEARGLLADCTDKEGLAAKLAGGVTTFYVGYDPTSTSLHVGNLVPVILQARLQRAGHRPLVVVGGATGMIGDPSGKSAERSLLDEATLARNVAAIRAQLSRLLDFEQGPTGALLVDNADWFRGVGFLEFLRDAGKHLTINYMLAKDSVKARLESESGLSYTEFSYMLLQAWDFVELHRRYSCVLQAGGSDQWGNITAGCELQRKLGRPQLYGLVAPLLLDASGQKMGKTSSGERVWLDPQLTPPYAFYQYWLNVADADVGKLLRMFSWRSLGELDELLRAHAEQPSARAAQRALAADLTTWIHGADATTRSVRASQVLFGGSLEGVDDDTLAPLYGALEKRAELGAAELEAGVSIVDLFVRAGLASSKGEARRTLSQRGGYLSNQVIESADVVVRREHFAGRNHLLLRSGKKTYAIVRLTG